MNSLDFDIECIYREIYQMEYAVTIKYRELHALLVERRNYNELKSGNMGTDSGGITGQDTKSATT